jgi:hypothetical protein
MARLNQPQSSPVSPLRLLAIMVFLISISGGLVYLFAMPLKQVYWGGERQDGVGREQPRRGTWECPVTADRSQGPMAGSHPPLPPPLPPLLVPPPTNCASRTLLLQCMPG